MNLYIRVSEDDMVSHILEPHAQWYWKSLQDMVSELLMENSNNGEGPWYAPPDAENRSFCWFVEVNSPDVIWHGLQEIGKLFNLKFRIDMATEMTDI